jgi:diguanylate cyclase (GGDEF)-like protein
MPQIELAPAPVSGPIGVLRPRRLIPVALAALAALAISACVAVKVGDWPAFAIMMAAAAPLLWAVHRLQVGRGQGAERVILVTLTAVVAALIVGSNGLRDEAVVAIPGILVLASMFASTRYFLGTLAVFVAVLVAICAAEALGWYQWTVLPPDATTLVNLIGVLGVTAYFIWLMARDLRRALARLATENEKLRESHARIDSLAHHDALTGLPNRILARDRFERAVAMARRGHQSVALLFLDLDNFKAVNDSLGHAVGDLLLCDVAARLTGILRSTDTVSRQGGDEFLIVMGAIEDKEAVEAAAAVVADRLSEPFQLENLEVSATCSIGVAVYPHDGTDFDTLLKHADLAMYRAKDSGRNAFRFYDARMNDNVVETLHLLSGLHSAVSRNEFVLHYQPQLDLRAGRIVGAEALIRWHHPELGFLPPGRFIAVAERSGLMSEVGRWVLREACAQIRRWQDEEGFDDLVVAVNLSPVQLRRDDFERDLEQAVGEAGVAWQRIELELTESMLVADSPALSALLGRLQARGLRLAIDDFGTGYSNLGYLQRFKVARLKIDQSFVRRMLSDTGAESIVRAVIQMAHSLGIQVFAEGIEDSQTLARLVELGCDGGQGFLWSQALPAGAFVEFCRRHRAGDCAVLAA